MGRIERRGRMGWWLPREEIPIHLPIPERILHPDPRGSTSLSVSFCHIQCNQEMIIIIHSWMKKLLLLLLRATTGLINWAHMVISNSQETKSI